MGQFRNWLVGGLAAVLMTAGSVSAQAPAGSPVARHGQLSVEGTRIIDEHGIPTQLRGMSLYGWSNNGLKYYNANVIKWLTDDWKSSVVRAAVPVAANGTVTAANKTNIRNVINAAIANGIYVIIDYHSHDAHRFTANAVAYFQEIAREFGRHPNIIYEIYNEPDGDAGKGYTWKDDIKPYSQTMVNAIRAIDPNNIIIIGTPSWSQRVDIAAADPVNGSNLTYAMHFYASASQHESMRTDLGPAALSMNKAIFASEFGIGHWDVRGPIDTINANIWFDFLNEHGISWANWALSDIQNEDNAALRTNASVNGGWNPGSLVCNVPYMRSDSAYQQVLDARRIRLRDTELNDITPIDPDRMVNRNYARCTAHGHLGCSGSFIRNKLRMAHEQEAVFAKVVFRLNSDEDNSITAIKTVRRGSTISVNDILSAASFTREGYINDGVWYTDKAGTVPFEPGITVVNANTTLYLKWSVDYASTEFVFLLDDFENGGKVNNFGYDWQISAYSGGVITNAQSGDNFNAMTFAPKAGITPNGSSGYSAVLEYNVPGANSGVSMTSSLTGDENIPAGEVMKDLKAVSFWAKGTPGNSVWFMLQTTQYAANPINYNRYHVKFTPTSEWQQYTFNIGPIVPAAVEGGIPSNNGGSAGDFRQSAGWGSAFTFNPENLTKLVWEIDGGSPASRNGNLHIDDVQFITLGNPISVTLPVAVTYKAGDNGKLRLGNVVTTNDITLKRQPGAAVSSISAIADAGYEFAGWSDGVTDNPRTDAAAAMTVTALFEKTPVVIEKYTFMFDDLEDGDHVNNFGYDWQVSAYSGGVVTNGNNSFAPKAGTNPNGSSGYSAALEYNVPGANSGVSMTSSLTSGENIPAGEVLKDLTAISFWAKGTPGNSVWFMLQTTQYAATPINYNRYHVKFTPTSEWQQYTFDIGTIVPVAVEGGIPSNNGGSAGDFRQSAGWGSAFTFSPENLTKLVWEIDGGSPASRNGSLYIDDVQFVTIGNPINITPPDVVVEKYTFMFDDLEDGDHVNNFGYDWQVSAYSGGIVTNALPGNNSFAPKADTNPNGSSGYSAVLEYNVPGANSGVSMTSSLTSGESTPVGEVLKDLTAISFWAKGTPGNSVWFMLQTTQYASTPINYNRYHVKFTPTSEWQQYTFNVGDIVPAAVEGGIPSNNGGSAGDFRQSAGWGSAFTFSPENMTKLVWEIDGGSPASRIGNLYIDDVQFVTVGSPINVILPAAATYQASETNESNAPQILAKAPVVQSNATVLTAAPNIVTVSAGAVNFLCEGEQIVSANLTVYDASGKIVNKLTIRDRTAGNMSKREVGKWHLNDTKGRPVKKGTYLVRGTIKTADGKSERVSLMIGVK